MFIILSAIAFVAVWIINSRIIILISIYIKLQIASIIFVIIFTSGETFLSGLSFSPLSPLSPLFNDTLASSSNIDRLDNLNPLSS